MYDNLLYNIERWVILNILFGPIPNINKSLIIDRCVLNKLCKIELDEGKFK